MMALLPSTNNLSSELRQALRESLTIARPERWPRFSLFIRSNTRGQLLNPKTTLPFAGPVQHEDYGVTHRWDREAKVLVPSTKQPNEEATPSALTWPDLKVKQYVSALTETPQCYHSLLSAVLLLKLDRSLVTLISGSGATNGSVITSWHPSILRMSTLKQQLQGGEPTESLKRVSLTLPERFYVPTIQPAFSALIADTATVGTGQLSKAMLQLSYMDQARNILFHSTKEKSKCTI